MGQIRVLSDEAASQVAAGEVVERPSSIVKELCENSLDAGASRIVIEFAKGGMRLISVRDDGCGMDSDDAVLCLERHATSKLRSSQGLPTVRTMGFRGEALPSISSVSRFRLITRPPASPAGTEVIVGGGRLESVREAGTPPGTTVEARDLFFNLPARRKFLRGEETEAAQILQVVHNFALSALTVAIECRRDGKPLLNLPPADSLEVRLNDLFGASFLRRLLPLPTFVGDGFEVQGFISRPGEGRRDRQQQWIILNGRPIVCPEVSQALREAYAGALPAGQYPLAVLHLAMDPTLVDCNVHPAKRIVRFVRPEAVRRGVYDATQMALRAPSHKAPQPAAESLGVTADKATPGDDGKIPPAPSPFSAKGATAFPQTPLPPPPLPHFAQRDDQTPHSTAPTASPPPQPTEAPGGPPPPTFRILGKLSHFYFLFSGPEGLVILDVRSARERIAFERLLRQIEAGGAPVQRLLLPEIIELPVREYAWILDQREALSAAGFLIEPFGASTLKIEGIPALGTHCPAAGLLHTVATSLRNAGRLPRGHGLREAVARSVCGAALGALPAMGAEEAERLLIELLACELPYAAPGGQPTLIQFSFAELDRKFGRVGVSSAEPVGY